MELDNIVSLELKTPMEVKNFVVYKYGSLVCFCKAHNLSYTTYYSVFIEKSFRHKHIKKICQILELDINKIEKWKDV